MSQGRRRQKNLIPAVAITISIAGLYFLYSKRHQEHRTEIKEPTKPPTANTSFQTFASNSELIAHQNRLLENRKQDLRMRASGFIPIALDPSAPTIHYQTRAFLKLCQTGDLDIIADDLKLSEIPDNHLVFTVESLSATRRRTQPISQTISLPKLKSPSSGEFKLVLPETTEVFGLFLCSFNGDISRSERICANLDPIQMTELGKMQAAIRQNRMLPDGYPKGPKIYFFQMLILGKESVYFYKNNQTLNYNFELMKKTIGADRSHQLERDLKKGVEFMKMVDSISPSLINRGISLTLPYRGDCPMDRNTL